jgi:transposase
MLQITPQHKILFYPDYIDFRKGIDKIVGFCRAHIDHNPLSGAFFFFINTRMSAIKILVYDGTGLWLCHKRFYKGKIMHLPQSQEQPNCICSTDINVILNQCHAVNL